MGLSPFNIPLLTPQFDGREMEYLSRVLAGADLEEEFEDAVRAVLGVQPPVVAVSSGTAALHSLLMALGVQRNDEVIVPDLTFVATANVVRYMGAWPVFVDVDPQYWQIDPGQVGDFLDEQCEKGAEGFTYNKTTGRRVAGIIPVHLLGQVTPMIALLDALSGHQMFVVDDAAEALGARYLSGQPITQCGILSFNINKIITAGGGGMVIIKNEEVARRVRHITSQARSGTGYFHDRIGFNYRISPFQAAVGLAQLEQLPRILLAKQWIREVYEAEFADYPEVEIVPQTPWGTSNWWLNVILLKDEVTVEHIWKELGAAGIETRRMFMPLHSLPPFHDCQAVHIVNAPRIYQRALCLPSSAWLRSEGLERVIQAVRQALQVVGTSP